MDAPTTEAQTGPQAVAEAVGRTMFEKDAASRALGIELLEIAPGYARLAMNVDESMTNGHAVGHGGYTFALADTAMAFASNSHNRIALAQTATVTFTQPVKAGMRLVAEAREQNLSGRTGIYDVTVRDDDAATVAVFRGVTVAIGGDVVANLGGASGDG